MQAVTATEFARNFSQMLDQVEHHGVTLSIVRNHKQVATVAPQRRTMNAMEAFGDLYRPLEGPVNDDWMADVRKMDQLFHSTLEANLRDPWEDSESASK